MLFNRNFAFFQFLVNLPCYSMGILHFSQFSLIFYVIQWESCNFSLFCKFSMLFNGKLVFCQFPMLFNGNLRLEKLWGGRTDRRTNVRTSGDSPQYPTGHRPFGAAAQKGKKKRKENKTKQKKKKREKKEKKKGKEEKEKRNYSGTSV